jgi:hypothetical protein
LLHFVTCLRPIYLSLGHQTITGVSDVAFKFTSSPLRFEPSHHVVERYNKINF